VRQSEEGRIAFRYRVDRWVNAVVTRIMGWITPRSSEQPVNFRQAEIKKILLVRRVFRMGDSILATSAIFLFRKNFPGSKIDFVGPRISKVLFENLPVDHRYEVFPSFPKVCWSYLTLLRQVRQTKYDLAVDVSGSSAASGSFIVGFSGARFRVGLKGKWDRWFNVRLHRPSTINKYRKLPELVGSMGLETELIFPTLVLSPEEIEGGRKRSQALIHRDEAPIVGVFVGGRKTRGKRWARENFLKLVTQLRAEGARSIILVGPEERELIPYFRGVLGHRVPVLFEPNARSFAALLANGHLFVACDSGLVHLACALGVRTVANFLKDNFDRWGPPADLGRIVHREGAVSVDVVLEACRHELLRISPVRADGSAFDCGACRERRSGSPGSSLSSRETITTPKGLRG